MSNIRKNITIEVIILVLIAFLPVWLHYFLHYINPETYNTLPSLTELFWAIVLSSFTFFATTFIKFYPHQSVNKFGLLIASGSAILLLAFISSNFFLPDFQVGLFSGITCFVIFLVVFITSIWSTYLEWTGKESPVVEAHNESSDALGDKLDDLLKEAE